MTRYWVFNENSCKFDTCSRQKAFSTEVGLPVIISNRDEISILDEGVTKSWSEGERYKVAGIEFDRESFEWSLAWLMED